MVKRSEEKIKIIIVCGPTAVGKTKLAIQLARELNGEIIAADSQTVLKGFDIGTAKPSLQERAETPHHLLDVAEFGEVFDAARFASLASQVIEELRSRGNVPILCGGTGLYLKALLHGFMEAPSRDEAFRKKLEKKIKEGALCLHEELRQIDAKRASEIHPNDNVRIIRALEIYHLTGKKPSDLASFHQFPESAYQALKIGLNLPREELNQRINARVLQMLKEGWLEEVKGLLEKGCDLIHQKTQALGYSILARHLKGKISLEEASLEIQKQTRSFAKQQLTWFRADQEIDWFDPREFDTILSKVKSFLKA